MYLKNCRWDIMRSGIQPCKVETKKAANSMKYDSAEQVYETTAGQTNSCLEELSNS